MKNYDIDKIFEKLLSDPLELKEEKIPKIKLEVQREKIYSDWPIYKKICLFDEMTFEEIQQMFYINRKAIDEK